MRGKILFGCYLFIELEVIKLNKRKHWMSFFLCFGWGENRYSERFEGLKLIESKEKAWEREK